MMDLWQPTCVRSLKHMCILTMILNCCKPRENFDKLKRRLPGTLHTELEEKMSPLLS